MQAARRVKPEHALVVGLGKTGLSCVQYLRARGYAVSVVDSRKAPPMLNELARLAPEVAVHAGGFASSHFADADLLVVSPGVSLREPPIARAIARGVPAVGDIELFVREVQGRTSAARGRMPGAAEVQGRTSAAGGRMPGAAVIRQSVVAITGANGKSTVTTLVGAMCQAAGRGTAVAGNIGTPVLSLLHEAPREVYVLELSSFQLETTQSLNAAAATVLNIAPDHMDRYANLDEYAAAKARIFQGGGAMVLNRDDPLVMAMQRPGRPTLRFGLAAPESDDDFGVIVHQGEEWLVRGTQRLFPAREVPLPGRHNLANALAAMALASCVGVPVEAMLRALHGFKGLPHRTEWVAEADGIRWIDDSKGTNIGATVAALSGMREPVVLIAGGDGKGADFSPLKPAVAAHARAVVLIGRDAPLIECALGHVVPVVYADDMDDAVAKARRLAGPGDVVLLSPACASFDMFKNFEHRGEVFKRAVHDLLGGAR